MIDRIKLIIQAKNITPTQLANEIKIQPSGMSHIMSGRNKPSLDFIMRVLNRYPEIDTDWLLFGKGEMYKTATSPVAEPKFGTDVPENTQVVETQPEPLPAGAQMDIFSSGTDIFTPQKPVPETLVNETVEKTEKLQPFENQVLPEPAQLDESGVENRDLCSDTEKTVLKKDTRKAVRYLVFYSDHTFEEFLRADN